MGRGIWKEENVKTKENVNGVDVDKEGGFV
jgi:hypothetical protein